MRNLALLAASVLLLLAGWLLLDEGPIAAPVDVARDEEVVAEEETREPAELARPGATEVAPAPEGRTAHAEEERAAIAPASPDVAAPRERVLVRGRVVLRDAEENVYERESGVLRLVLRGEGPAELEVPIEEGAFEVEVARGRVLLVDEVTLGGRACALDMDAREFTADADEELLIPVRLRVPSSLRVVDRATGRDLSGLELVNRGGWSFADAPLPDWSETLFTLDGPSSPVALPQRDGKQAWWVRAPGYAWVRVDFDHAYGGERIVLLDREAVLIVDVLGGPADTALDLRLTRDAEFMTFTGRSRVAFERPGPQRIDGLAPGGVTVELVPRGSDDFESESLAREGVELAAGEETRLLLDLTRTEIPPAEEPTVLVSGTLAIPAEFVELGPLLEWHWYGDDPRAGVTVFLDDAPERRGAELVYTWSTDELVPGPWAVEVRPFCHAVELNVGPAGARGVALRVPPPAHVLLRLVTPTGDPIEGASVSYSRDEGDRRSYGGSGRATGEPGTYRLVVVPGPIVVDASTDAWSIEDASLDVGPGEQTLVLELQPIVSLTLVLKDGGTVVPQEISWWLEFEVEALEGEARVRSYSFDGSASMTAELTAAGRFRLLFAEVDGYRPIEPMEVTVEVGGMVVEVPLQRAD